MEERRELSEAIAALEARRGILGSKVVDEALAPLKRRLEGLDAASGQAEGAERKIVTALFADFAGFTSLVARSDPEQVRELVGSAFGALVPVIERYGGTIEKFMGDGVMALFGAPRTHGDDPRRACLAALAMLEALARFNARRGSQLAMHIGIGTGLVVAGSMDVAGHRSYSALGNAVNRAARLSSMAGGGAVLTDAATAELSGTGLDLEEQPPARLKGFEGEVRLFSLRGQGSTAPNPGACLDFVGRASELAALDSAWRPAPGERALVAILGEQGIGKTRLMAEWRSHLLLRATGGPALFFMEARGSSYDAHSPYRTFAGLLEGLSGASPLGSEAERRGVLDTWLAGLGIGGVEASTLVALVEAGSAGMGLGEEAGSAFPDPVPALARLFEAMADGRYLVFVAEDWQHWDRPSSEALLSLAAGAFGPPSCWAMIGSPRASSFPLGPVHGTARVRRIELGPLSPGEVKELAAAVLSPVSIPAAPAMDEELSQAGGNPLFVSELLARRRTGAEQGYCDPDFAAAEACDLSPALFSLVAARIDSLSNEGREAARVASALGDRFPLRLLAALAGQAGVDVLLEEGLLHLGPEEGTAAFHNGLVRELVYATILERRRKAIHGAIAKSIRDDWPEYAARRPDLLARHWHRAGEPRRALPHYRAAGESLYWKRAHEEAAGLLATGLSLARDAGSPIATAELLLLLGKCKVALGAEEEALALYEEARAIYGRLSNRGQEQEVLRAAAHAANRLRGREAAEPLLREALSLAVETGNLKDEAKALGDLGELLKSAGEPKEAMPLLARAIKLAETTKLLALYRRMLFARAECMTATDSPEAAREAFRRCAEICDLSGEERLGGEARRRADSC